MTFMPEPAAGPALRRAFVATIEGVEWRDSGNGNDFTLTGHAAVFDRWSLPLAGAFRERILPGAFTDALAGGPDVRALFNHDPNYVLGRTKSGTLALAEDDNGLRVWARVARTSWARDLRASMQRGDIDQMSFAFTVAEDEWREGAEGELHERDIVQVDQLYDVSVVTDPAYPDTDAAMRDLRHATERGLIGSNVITPEWTFTGNTATSSTGSTVDFRVATAETDPLGAQPVAQDDPAGGLRVARLKARARVSLAQAKTKG